MRDRFFIDSIVRQLEELPGERIGIVTHVGGDADSISSCMVLRNILTSIYNKRDVYIIVPDQVSELSSNLARALGLEISTQHIDVDSYVALDLGSSAQLGSLRSHVHPPVVLIDHHEFVEKIGEWHSFVSTSYQSTAEIILEIALSTGYKLSPDEATALFVGIYLDTVRLSIADSETLRKVGILGELGAMPSSILSGLEAPMDDSERIARLKAAKRSEIYRCGELIVATSRLGAFRPSGAKALLGLGAHIAVVGDVDGDVVDITLRQSPEVSEKYSLNLVRDVVSPLASLFQGEGGGHASVARLRARGDFSEVMSRCVKQISYCLGAMPVKVED
jgi:nanoRNase/pAp phosphatase (c-di-AMP/oligoRNAs hydrolase)